MAKLPRVNKPGVADSCLLKKSLHTSQVAHQAGAYSGFLSMKRLRILLVHRRVTPQH